MKLFQRLNDITHATKIRNSLLFISSHKTYIYPAVLLVLLLGLAALRISGSSIGAYYPYLYGQGVKDTNLIFGRPQAIRSDEWLVNTQLTIAQENSGFHQINTNISGGKDMSLITDAPYLEWSEAFKPQNFVFFILPLENAFAFKWWFILFILLVAVYLLSLRLLPGKIWIAVASSIILGFSPFVFWWYQTGTIMALAYGFLITVIGMSLIQGTTLSFFGKKLRNKQSLIIKILTLGYLLTAFGLILYPPFQVPVALVVAFFLMGFGVDHLFGKHWNIWLKTILPFIGSIAIAGAVFGAFLLTRSDTIVAITNTVYPGQRISESGGYDIRKLLVTYLQPQLQRKSSGDKYYENQSESSSFVFLPIVFLAPFIAFLVWLYARKKEIDWILVSLVMCNALFLSHLFLHLPLWLTELFFLHLVPTQRLMIGFGMLGIVSLLYFIVLMNKHVKKLSTPLKACILLYAVFYFSITLWMGFITQSNYPGFIPSTKLLILLNGVVGLGFLLLFSKKITFGLCILVLYSIGSVFYINPLYQGLGPINDGRLPAAIQSVSTPSSTWAVVDNLLIENIPQMSNHSSITGVTFYPSINLWKNYTGQENAGIYNRYAHVLLSSKNLEKIKLIQPDLFTIHIQCGQPFNKTVTNIMSSEELHFSCLTLATTVRYPAATFYFYTVSSQ